MKVMKVAKWLVFGLFCALLCGCGKQVENEGIPVVELSKAGEEVDLKLSDLLENIRVIPLETRPDVLLPGHFSTWVGEKYIVTLGEDAMHLFTVDGKYVRKLAERGRGPGEYSDGIEFCVDKQERYCYLASGVNGICVIDLEKGGIVRKISTGKKMPYRLWYSDKDNTLVYALFDFGRMEGDICRIALDGTLLHTVESSSKSGTLQYFWCMNDTICYKMQFCDTLFLLADTVKIPYCRMVTERPFSMALESGRVISILFENKDRIILCCDEVRKHREGDGFSIFSEPCGYYVVEKSDFSLRKVRGFYADIFDYTEMNLSPKTNFFPLQVSWRKVCRNINVLRFKELLKDKLDSPLVPEYLKELYARLDEEDNPVLLVGDIK